MLRAPAITLAFLTCTGLLGAQQPALPSGPPPRLRVIHSLDEKTGELVFRATVSKSVPVTVTETVNVNGQAVMVTKTVLQTTMEMREEKLSLAKARIITPEGKDVPLADALQRLKVKSVIAVAETSQPPEAAYLAVLNPRTLVIIPPAEQPKEEKK